MSHTPGPWRYRAKSGSIHLCGTDGRTYGKLVLAPQYEYDSGCDIKVSDDDLNLILAAPDLLEALKIVLPLLPLLKIVLPFAGHELDMTIPKDYLKAMEECVGVARAAISKAEGDPNATP